MSLDWDAVLGPSVEWSLVANLPYNIATPLVLDLLEQVPAIARMLVMVQREVGERLAAGPGSKVYGIPSVKVAYRRRPRSWGGCPPRSSFPLPGSSPSSCDCAGCRSRRWRPIPARCSGWWRPASASGARCCAARWPVWSMRQRSSTRGVRPEARAEELSLADWDRLARADVGT
jgi:16S rRNA (adenine1518-N6/adenine1519-N6)-dimethyltransferase